MYMISVMIRQWRGGGGGKDYTGHALIRIYSYSYKQVIILYRPCLISSSHEKKKKIANFPVFIKM